MNLAIARRRPHPTQKVISVRPLVPADLERLRELSSRKRIKNLREIHHNMARMIAAGLTNAEIGTRLGYNPNTICVLRTDPAMIELIAHYVAEIDTSWRESVDHLHADAVRAMKIGARNLATRFEALDENPDAIPLPIVARVTSDLMDRFGYGKHQTSTNINVDFAAKLEAAINKSKTITLSRKVAAE